MTTAINDKRRSVSVSLLVQSSAAWRQRKRERSRSRRKLCIVHKSYLIDLEGLKRSIAHLQERKFKESSLFVIFIEKCIIGRSGVFS